jgi:hypothetical protein
MTPTWGELVRRIRAIVRTNYLLAKVTYYDPLAAERRADQWFGLNDICPPDESYTRPQGSA